MELLQNEASSTKQGPEVTVARLAAASSDTEETLRAVRRIARALALSSRDLARQHDLTATQLLCLRSLKEQEALSAGALAKALSLSPQTATGLIDRLEARELVTRGRSNSDRRCVLVSLSEAGRAVIEATGPMLQDRFIARFDALASDQRRSLRDALETIVTLLEADMLDAAPVLDAGHVIGQPEKSSTSSNS